MKKSIIVFWGILLYYVAIPAQVNCDPVELPFYTGFEDGNIECWTTIDSNGDNLSWHIDETQATIGCSSPGDKVMSINYNFSYDMDDWLFSPALQLEPGIEYTFSFSYGNDNSTSNVEAISVYLAYFNTVNGAMDGQLIMSTVEVVGGCHDYQTTVSVATSGIYYLAFHGTSAQNQNILMIDDVYLGEGILSIDNFGDPVVDCTVFVSDNLLNICAVDRKCKVMVEVLALTGKLVFSIDKNLIEGKNTMALPALPPGIYLVIIREEERVVTAQKIAWR